MSRPPAPLPPELTAAFRADRARELGVTSGRLAAADLAAPFRGVRMQLSEDVPDDSEAPLAQDEALRADILARVHAHRLVLPAHAFYVGDTARAIWGVHLEGTTPDVLEVGAILPHRGVRRPGVTTVRVRPELVAVRQVDGIPVASPASVWAMSGHTSDTRSLVALGDAVVRVPRDVRGRPIPGGSLATVAQLGAALCAGRRRGAGRLREALELVRVGSMSPLETDARLVLLEAGLPEPVLDHEVRDSAGSLLGISDLAYPHRRIAVEVEGDHHRTSRSQWNRDLEKYAAYAAADWDVVRLSATHIRGAAPSGPQMVRGALERRGWA